MRISPTTRFFFLLHTLIIPSTRTLRTASTMIKFQSRVSNIQIITMTCQKMLSILFMIHYRV